MEMEEAGRFIVELQQANPACCSGVRVREERVYERSHLQRRLFIFMRVKLT